MLFSIRTRRKETPWEVVDSKAVEPVPMYYDDEGTFNHGCRVFGWPPYLPT
jgi:hypothetical protein